MALEFSTKTPLAIKRASRRARVTVAAKLLTAGEEMDIRIRDLSRAGALAESPRPPARGSQSVLLFGAAVIPASIAWVVGRRFGLEFDQLVDESLVRAFGSNTLI